MTEEERKEIREWWTNDSSIRSIIAPVFKKDYLPKDADGSAICWCVSDDEMYHWSPPLKRWVSGEELHDALEEKP